MDRVFVYWDHSNLVHEAERLADQLEGTPDARHLIRVHFDNLLRLAHADRPLAKAVAAGSVPPEMRQLWNRMENAGVEVHLVDRYERDRGERELPDRLLQLRMLEDALDNNGDPGVVALLTGDGAGYAQGVGFHRTLERMRVRDWEVSSEAAPSHRRAGSEAGPGRSNRPPRRRPPRASRPSGSRAGRGPESRRSRHRPGSSSARR